MNRCCCPICKREYDSPKKVCACGFEGVEYPIYECEGLSRDYESRRLFNLYKFTKRVATGVIPYEPSPLQVLDIEDGVLTIDEALEKRGLALVDEPFRDNRKTVARDGLLALRTDVEALILNSYGANAMFLDESHVKALFFGKDFRELTDGFFYPFSAVRYLWVDGENPAFASDNNVMYNKDKTLLISYARLRPEEEFRVPASVRSLSRAAFYYPKHLRRLYLPRGIKIPDGALTFYNDRAPEVIYY